MAMRIRRQGGNGLDAWPGYVDALSTLLMVIIFVLLVFIMAQGVLTSALSGRDQALDELRRDLASLRGELTEERYRSAGMSTTMAELERGLAQAEVTRRSLTGQVQDLRDLNTQLSAQRDRLTLQETEARAERESANAQVDRLRAALSQANERADTLTAERDAARTRLGDLERRIVALETASRADRTTIEQGNSRLAAEIRRREAAETSAAEQAAVWSAARNELAARQRDLETRLREAEARLGTAREERATVQRDLETRLREAEARLGTARDERAAVQRELESRTQAADARLAAANTAANEERTALRREVETQRQDADTRVAAAVAAAREQLAALRRELEAQRQETERRQSELLRLSAALDLAQGEVRTHATNIADLERQLNVVLADRVEQLRRYRSEFFGRLRDVLESRSGIQVVGDRFVFQSEVLFPIGSAELSAAGRGQMTTLALTVRQLASEIPADIPWVLRVDGHSDRSPVRGSSNWELSAARAITVVKFLISLGVPAERLAATAFAEFQPLDDGTAPEDLARNRRIELRFTDR